MSSLSHKLWELCQRSLCGLPVGVLLGLPSQLSELSDSRNEGLHNFFSDIVLEQLLFGQQRSWLPAMRPSLPNVFFNHEMQSMSFRVLSQSPILLLPLQLILRNLLLPKHLPDVLQFFSLLRFRI
jgi:hypothetical protein